MGSSLSRIQAIIYDRDFPRFPRPAHCPLSAVKSFYTPNGYIVPMEFRIHFFPRISAFSRRTKMHLNGMLLIGTEFFKIIVPL